jgi:hypothetical protein
LKLGEPIDAEPVALYGESEDDATLVDAPVDIAGFGVDTDGVPVTSLNFLAERIARVDAETVVVDGHGRTGACIGDSGGPMLLRDKTGSLAVAGVLSEGAGTCTGEDHYVRADLLRAWVSATDGVTTGSGSCGSVTPVGFCRQGRPIWCEGGTLTSVSCAAGTACGFSAHAGGYRCVAPQGDACAGVDDLGKCDGDLARVCREGRVDETDCSACGAACAWNASTGRYDCLLN